VPNPERADMVPFETENTKKSTENDRCWTLCTHDCVARAPKEKERCYITNGCLMTVDFKIYKVRNEK